MVALGPAQADLDLAGDAADGDARDVAKDVGNVAQLAALEHLGRKNGDGAADPVGVLCLARASGGDHEGVQFGGLRGLGGGRAGSERRSQGGEKDCGPHGKNHIPGVERGMARASARTVGVAGGRTRERPPANPDAAPAARSSLRRSLFAPGQSLSPARATRAGRSPGSRVNARCAPSQDVPAWTGQSQWLQSRIRDRVRITLAAYSCRDSLRLGRAGPRTQFPLPTRCHCNAAPRDDITSRG